jgi:general L-amino acid transport system substrate-binding protein
MKNKRLRLVASALGIAALSWAWPAYAGKTLDAVRARGNVVCGVNTGLPGFSAADDSGRWTGLDVDICRALAAAVLGDGLKVKYVPLGPYQRFTALQAGEIDVLSRNTTFSLTRDASLGLHQTVVTYYDGQGFLVPLKSKVKSIKQLKGQAVCVQSGTTTETNLMDYSKANGLDLKPMVFERVEVATRAYFAGRCAAYTTDASGLASARSAEPAGVAAAHAILPDLISKEPLGPMVRRGDDEWLAIVRWVIYGLIEAEEYGVTQGNLDQLKSSSNPSVQRLLGTTEDTGKLLGLDRDWLVRAVRTTGNYGEIYERNVGSKSPLRIPRGLNELWSKGGLMYAFPVR